MPELTIEVSENGIRRAHAHVLSASGGTELGHFTAALALPLSLLDRTAREYGSSASEVDEAIGPQIFVSRSDDDTEPTFEQMPLRVGLPVRCLSSMDLVPSWFTDAMKKAFSKSPNHILKWEMFSDAEAAVSIFIDAQFWCTTAGWSSNDGHDDVLVVEPEVADSEFINAVASFCEQTDLTFLITGVSFAQPSTTFRIEIFPKVKS